MNNQKARITYILRRSVWTGCTTRNDLIRAFSISPNLASADLSDAVAKYPDVLSRNGRLGVNFTGMDVPFNARASKLLEMFERSAGEWETGLTKDEIQVLVNNMPAYKPDDKILNIITFACIKNTPIKIKYTGLNMDEVSKSRVICPLGLEFNGRQWRVIATDEGSSIQKTFVLARISEASFLLNPKKYQSEEKLINDLRRYRVTLNEALTQDQINVLKSEFGIINESFSMSSRNLFEFKKLFCKATAEDVKSKVVWPIFSSIEVDKRD